MLDTWVKVLTVLKGLCQYLIALKTSLYREMGFSIYSLETSVFLNVATKKF